MGRDGSVPVLSQEFERHHIPLMSSDPPGKEPAQVATGSPCWAPDKTHGAEPPAPPRPVDCANVSVLLGSALLLHSCAAKRAAQACGAQALGPGSAGEDMRSHGQTGGSLLLTRSH